VVPMRTYWARETATLRLLGGVRGAGAPTEGEMMLSCHFKCPYLTDDLISSSSFRCHVGLHPGIRTSAGPWRQ